MCYNIFTSFVGSGIARAVWCQNLKPLALKMAEPEAKESLKAVAVCFVGFVLKVERSSALAGWLPVFIGL